MQSADGKSIGFEPKRGFSLLSYIEQGYYAHPSKRLVICMHESLSYVDAFYAANALAWYFQAAHGVVPGATVALSSPNVLFAPVVIAAVEACGARLALFPATLAKGDFSRLMSLVDPSLVIVAKEEHCRIVHELNPDVGIMSIGCAGGGFAPSVEGIVEGFGAIAGARKPVDRSEKAEFVVFSSGSTGLPKAIVNQADSFAFTGSAIASALSITANDKVFVPVPMAHVFGVVCLYAVMGSCATIVTMAKFLPEEACALIEGTRATVHMGVPTMYVREHRMNQDRNWDLSSLRCGLVAGAGCPVSVFYDFENIYGCRLILSYGMSETASALTIAQTSWPLKERAVSDGFPIDGVRIRIDEKTGEIMCKTPTMMKGVIVEGGRFETGLDEEGWFHTGDIGFLDEKGRLSISGRIKDIIIRGGINIFPAEVERVYEGNPDVSECCLCGYPDSELGERTALAVTLRNASSAVTSLDLRSFAKGRIEKAKIPDIVIKVKDFPHLASGKIDKKQLKRQVLEELHRIGALNGKDVLSTSDASLRIDSQR